MGNNHRMFAPRPTAGWLVALGLGLAACGAADQIADPPAPPTTPTAAEDEAGPAPPTPAAEPGPNDEAEPNGAPPGTAPDDAPTATPAPTATAVPTATPNPTELEVAIPENLEVELTPLLDVVRPVALATRAGSDNLFLATNGGRVIEVAVTGDDAREVAELLDLSGRISGGNEQGLLGLTFSPDGTELFVNLTDRRGASTVVGWTMDGDRVDPTTERTLLVVDQPAANHNGGDITFGPDGHLYTALGDGGGAGDPFATGQDPTSLLATIIRIAPNGDGYDIPPDNPFVERGGAPEVWIWGARNPWRFSFDTLTGDLWIADVGQDAVEEVNVLYASDGGGRGANLGWSDVEGSAPFRAGGPPASDYVAPIHEYTHAEGCSVTGGYVYRGTAIPELFGHYLFADYCAGAIWGLASSESQGLLGRFDLGLDVGSPAAFGQGPDGEIYVLSHDSGLYRIDPG